MPLILGLVLLILAEVSLYVTLGAVIGLLPTLAVVLGSGVLGALIVRAQGRMITRRLVDAALDRQNPLKTAGHGVLKALAGVLLILPGFLTDVLGLILLIPAVRRMILRKLADGARRHAVDLAVGAMQAPRWSAAPVPTAAEPEVVEGVAEEVPSEGAEPQAHPDRRPSGWTRP
jgi:UPF0716 protein FxsA